MTEPDLIRRSLGLVLMTLDNLIDAAVSEDAGAAVAAERKAVTLVASRAQLLLAMVEANPAPDFQKKYVR